MMRKIVAILLTMVLLMGLTACGDAPADPVSNAVSVGESEDSDVVTTATSADNTEESSAPTGVEENPTESTANSSKTAAEDKSTTTKESGRSTTKNSTTAKATTTAKTSSATVDPDVTGDYVTVNGKSSNLKTWVYQMADSGVCVREARFDSGKGGDPVTIVQITDVHIGTINDKDRKENNAALMWTYNKRKGAYPTSVENLTRCMEYASQYDQTVLTGDTIDYLSWGNLEAIQKYVWDKDPNALVALGNHDTTRTMSFPDQINDTSTLESRYSMAQSVWKHDIYYTSRVIKNKVMVIQLDNGQQQFWPEQLPKLKEDLATAKKKGYVVLLFVHIPLKTGVAGRIKSFYPNTYSQSFNGSSTTYNNTEATKQVYDLITNNADVVKGVFCGHEHYNFYMEIQAKTSDGKAAVIPQYLLTSSTDRMGFVLKITVK